MKPMLGRDIKVGVKVLVKVTEFLSSELYCYCIENKQEYIPATIVKTKKSDRAAQCVVHFEKNKHRAYVGEHREGYGHNYAPRKNIYHYEKTYGTNELGNFPKLARKRR